VSEPHEQWKRMLRPLRDCVAIERFGEALTPAEREHVTACPRCHSEMELWQRFNDPTTPPEEAEDVRWIKEEVARRGASGSAIVPTSPRRFAASPRMLAVAATIFLALGIGYLLDNRQPSIDVPAGREVAYRSAGITVIAPSGDLAAAPTQLEWTAVPGAMSYDVQVVEVDRAVLWRSSTREPRVEVPAAVSAQFVPGKTILWEVTARRDATVLAESGTQKFRVAVR
jgi:hypothetical protein